MSSSELSEPELESGAPDETNKKRRSGRVSRKPNLFTGTPVSSSKRKRNEAEDEVMADGEDEEGEEDGDEDESESEGEPDEEEMREKKAKARRTKNAPVKKPAAKRTKTNGSAAPAATKVLTKARRKKAKALDEEEAEQAGGLYGMSATINQEGRGATN